MANLFRYFAISLNSRIAAFAFDPLLRGIDRGYVPGDPGMASSISRDHSQLHARAGLSMVTPAQFAANAYLEIWDKPRSQPRRTADFIGSSAQREIGFPRKALGQPAQPGNSNRQNSWHVAPGVPAADLLPSRHLCGSISIRGMMLTICGGSAILSVTDDSEVRVVIQHHGTFGSMVLCNIAHPRE